jgi:hypothetical protein
MDTCMRTHFPSLRENGSANGAAEKSLALARVYHCSAGKRKKKKSAFRRPDGEEERAGPKRPAHSEIRDVELIGGRELERWAAGLPAVRAP